MGLKIKQLNSSRQPKFINKNLDLSNPKKYYQTPISFTSLNASEIGNNLIKTKGLKLAKKLFKFNDEFLNFIKKPFQRIFKRNELPFTEKPLIAADTIEDLSNAPGHQLTKSARSTWKKLEQYRFINKQSDVFNENGSFKPDAIEDLTDAIVGDKSLKPKVKKELLELISKNTDSSKYAQTEITEKINYLNDLESGKILPHSADAIVPPGEGRTSLFYQQLKYYDARIAQNHATQEEILKKIHNKTPKQPEQPLYSYEEGGETINVYRKDFNEQETAQRILNKMQAENPVPTDSTPPTLDFKDVPTKLNADQVESINPKADETYIQQLGNKVNDTLQDAKETVSEKFNGLKEKFVPHFGSTPAEEISQVTPNFPTLESFPAFDSSEIKSVNGLNQDSAVISNLADKVSEIAANNGSVSGFLEKAAQYAEQLSDIPGVDVAADALIVTKFITSIKHFANGEYSKGFVTTGTRLADTAVLPVKWVAEGIGGLKGLLLKFSGIKSDETGFFKGASAMVKKWNKTRTTLENGVLGIETDDLETRLAKVEQEQNKIISQRRQNVKETSKQVSSQILAFKNSETESFNKFNQMANNKLNFEKNRLAYYSDKAQEANTSSSEEAKAARLKFEALKVVQGQLNNEYIAIITDFSVNLENAKKMRNVELQNELKTQFDNARKAYDEKIISVQKRIEKVMQLIKVHENIEQKTNVKGLNRIAGYNSQKKELQNNFVSLVNAEKAGKKVDVPNGILLYGLKGTGKTILAKSLAEDTGCNIINLRTTLNAETDFRNLQKIATMAQENFLLDKKRTIILINEIDAFAPKDSEIAQDVTKFINNISKDYHCSIFATTNVPEEMDINLIKEPSFIKMSIPPANKENAKEILKYYTGDFADSDVNYDILAQKIIELQPEAAYSNSRIAKTVTNLLTSDNQIGKKLTHSDILKPFEEDRTDLLKNDLELFDKQQSYCENPQNNFTSNAKPIEINVNNNFIKTAKPITIEEKQANEAYNLFAKKISELPELKGKKELLKEVISDLIPIIDDNMAIKEVFEVVNNDNKNFIAKQALPAIIRNRKSLELEHSVGAVLKNVTPETLDSLDKLAANKENFKIKNQTDTINLLSSITPKNKNFAFDYLFPFLIENSETFRITRGGYMAKYLDVVTPENKDFMLKQAIPALWNYADKLGLEVSDITKIAKFINAKNLDSAKELANNAKKYNLIDDSGFLDVDEFCLNINKQTNKK